MDAVTSPKKCGDEASGIQRTSSLKPWLEAALDAELELPTKLNQSSELAPKAEPPETPQPAVLGLNRAK